jgi:hypothetical protein
MSDRKNGVVVCDASPLIFLAKLDCLHLIPALLGEVIIILRCVADEVLSPSCDASERRRLQDFLKTVEIVHDGHCAYESQTLSRSDCLTLTYAVANKVAWLVVDERLLRRIATEEGLRVVGFLGLLIQAADKGLITKVSAKGLIDSAISDHGMHISINLYRKLSDILGE